jgi:hypothetical protein
MHSNLRTGPSPAILLGIAACIMLPLLGGCNVSKDGSGPGSQPFNLYWSVAGADVNGDGKPDIVASYTHFTTGGSSDRGFVAVLLQDPTKPGTFLPPATYSVGDHPVALAVGDLNGDGKPDIVTANSTLNGVPNSASNNVSVLLQDPAKPGQFLAATTFATGLEPSAVAIGDLNGDGKADLAVADNTGISILFQSASTPGTFSSPMTFGLGLPATSVAIADVNGDGKADLLWVSGSSVGVAVQDPAKPGTFSESTTFAAGLQPLWVAVADLNGDGKPDLAVANFGASDGSSPGSVSVLLQNPAAPGSYLSARNYATGKGSSFVLLAQLNGSGKPDLVIGNIDSVSILSHDPNSPGQFQAATNYACSIPVSSVAVGDLNGDGKLDLVIADRDGVAIRFQDPTIPGAFPDSIVITK